MLMMNNLSFYNIGKIVCWVVLISVVLVQGQNVLGDTQPIRIGLALSGGGALGLAHIGVLKVLEQEGIPISYISGNSMGSLVGGLYAAGFSPTQIESIAMNINWWTLFSSEIPFGARYLPERQQSQRYTFNLRHHNFIPSLPSGLIPIQNVQFVLMRLLAEIEYNTFYEFDSLRIPYRAIAVDLTNGEKVIFRNKRLANAIRASIAIPGVFAPEQINGRKYVDGGVIQNLPIDPLLEFNPDIIIASLTMKHNPETSVSLIDVISKSIDLIGIEDLKRQKQLTDVLIEPNVDPFKHSDFFRVKELIKAGEDAAIIALPQIRTKINGRTVIYQPRKITARPLSIIRSIHFQGLKTTNENLLRSKLNIKPGSNLNFNRLIADLMRIYHTGFFEYVDYRLEFISADSVDVFIELEEKPFGFYWLGIRYDNFDNINLGLEIGQGNISGSGANIRAAFNLGNPSEIRLGLTGTRLYRLPFGYRIDGYWNSMEYSLYQNEQYLVKYDLENRGGIFEAGYIIGRDAFFDFGWNAYKVIYHKPPITFFDTLPNQQWIIGPKFRLAFNNFNNLDFPTRGITYHLTGLFAMSKLKASADFLKLNYYSEQMIPLTSWFYVHPRLEVGVSWGNLALAEYFRSGGENLVGFDKDEFTTDQKTILGISTDFRLFQLFNRMDYPFYLQLHSNLATFRKLNNIYKEFNFAEDFYWGIGIGIRTNTPIGPLQIILGMGDFTKSLFSDVRTNFTITVGREFRYMKE